MLFTKLCCRHGPRSLPSTTASATVLRELAPELGHLQLSFDWASCSVECMSLSVSLSCLLLCTRLLPTQSHRGTGTLCGTAAPSVPSGTQPSFHIALTAEHRGSTRNSLSTTATSATVGQCGRRQRTPGCVHLGLLYIVHVWLGIESLVPFLC